MARNPKFDWDKINWGLSNNQIRSLIGASLSTIAYQRRKRCGPSVKRIKWDLIDLSKNVDEIAVLLGVHRTTVYAARRKNTKS